MNARPKKDVTAAEQDVLEVLWMQEPATIRQITDELYAEPTPTNFSSVQKLLGRLEAKNFVKRKREGSVYLFESTISRKELIGQRLSAVAESLCDGSLTPLLEHLVDANQFTPEDRESLHALLEKLEKKTKTKKTDK